MLRAALSLALSPFRSNPKTTRARSESVSSLSDDEASPVKKRARTCASASASTSKARSHTKKAPARASAIGTKTAGGGGHKKAKKEETPEPVVKDDGKSYLAAGLYYNEPIAPPSKLRKRPSVPLPPPPARGKVGRKSVGDLASTAEDPADEATRRPLLPIPLHFGHSLLIQRRDFRLPFDIRRDFDPNAIAEAASGEPEDEVERRELSWKPERYGHLARSTLFRVWVEQGDLELTGSTLRRCLSREEGGSAGGAGHLRVRASAGRRVWMRGELLQ